MSNDFTTIWISKTNKQNLDNLIEKIKKIVRKKKISYDEMLSIILCVKSLDQQLSEMIAQDY